MEYIEVDKTTRQVLSAGSNFPMFGGEIIEVPELPQRKDPTINICDYYWDGTKFVYRPEGNVMADRMKEDILNSPFNKALIEFLETKLGLLSGSIRKIIKDKL
jgi:hypothetical protein